LKVDPKEVMPRFRYQALNSQQQPVSGQLQADSVTLAIAQLELQGLVVQSISQIPAIPEIEIGPPHESRSAEASADSIAGQAVLHAHIDRLLKRATTIVPALRAMAQELPSGRERRQFETVVEVLARGDASAALAAFGRLPEYWIAMLSAASAANDSQRVLQDFLRESQHSTELRRQWWQAIAYPALVLALAAAVLVLLSFLVVPLFRAMFVEFSLPLPWPTHILLQLAEAITDGRLLLFVLLSVAMAWLVGVVSRRLPAGLRSWWGDRFGTPLGRSSAMARVMQFTANLLAAGLNTPSALRIAGHASASPRLQRASWQLAEEIAENRGLDASLSANVLPQTVLYCLRSPMPPESRVRLLLEGSRCYSERASSHWSWTRGLIEPLAIFAVGFVVAAVVLALFLPMISLIHSLSG
jgi:type II secretory pathway component PulF